MQENTKHSGNTVPYHSPEYSNGYLLKCLQCYPRCNKAGLHLTPAGLNLKSAAETTSQKQVNLLTAIEIMITS